MFTVCVYITWVTTKCLLFVCILTGLQLNVYCSCVYYLGYNQMFTVCVYINWVTTKCLLFVCILTGLQLNVYCLCVY